MRAPLAKDERAFSGCIGNGRPLAVMCRTRPFWLFQPAEEAVAAMADGPSGTSQSGSLIKVDQPRLPGCGAQAVP
jgi:hypothetical protein